MLLTKAIFYNETNFVFPYLENKSIHIKKTGNSYYFYNKRK